MAATPEPYSFAPTFQRVIAGYCVTDPDFLAAVGDAIDPTLLTDPATQLAIRAVKELGQRPHPTLVVQRLADLHYAGKITVEELKAVCFLIDEFQDDPTRPDRDAVISTAAPVLRRRAEADAITASIAEFTARRDVGGKVIPLMERAKRIGQPRTSNALIILGTPAATAAIQATANLQRTSTGIGELDNALGGGAVRGELGVVSARTGQGKSSILAHFAAQSAWDGHATLVVTTEVDVGLWLARAIANLNAIPVESVVQQILAGVDLGQPPFRPLPLGPIGMLYLPPSVSTVAEVRAAAKQAAVNFGRPVEMLIVDSADDLAAPGPKDMPAHERVKRVYTELRSLAKDELRCWCWTCSQPKAASSTGKQRKRIDTDDLSDGMAKARICDKLLCAELSDDQAQVTFWLPKNRTGKARQTTAPLPIDLACSIVGPVVRFPKGTVGAQL